MIIIFNSLIIRKKERLLFLILLLLFSINWYGNAQSQLRERNSDIIGNASTLTMSFSTFFGGNNSDHGKGIATAFDGSYYITGYTDSADFPTLNAFNSTPAGNADVFIAKFSNGSSLLWSTYFGGSNNDKGGIITVALDGSCYVTGFTMSSNFPTLNAFNDTFGGNYDIYVAKFSTNGILLWSTYLGGYDNDEGYDIAVSSDGCCYVTGRTLSGNFPTKNAYNSTYGGEGVYGEGDVFVSKFASNGSLLWSTFLGGINGDFAEGIAVTNDGSCYVAGFTASGNFPTLNAFDNTFNGGDIFPSDAFITKFSTNGSLLWSTFLGGTDGIDYCLSTAVASDGSCFVTGATYSTDFPTLNAYDNTFNGGSYDLFITKFSFNGALIWSTYFGGEYEDIGSGITVDDKDSCYITGETSSFNFPTSNAYNNTFSGGGGDAFIIRLSSNGALYWSTFLGGNALDIGNSISVTTNGYCYIVGESDSANFPMLNAYDSTYNSNTDAFITKFLDIYDTTKPTISDIIYHPSTPTDKDNITISCLVTDGSGIQNVKLYYKVNTASLKNKEMILGNSNNYSTQIGSFNADDIIKFYIQATDNSPNHNIALDDNNTQYYNIIIKPSSTHRINAHGFLVLIAAIPTLVFILRKRR